MKALHGLDSWGQRPSPLLLMLLHLACVLMLQQLGVYILPSSKLHSCLKDLNQWIPLTPFHFQPSLWVQLGFCYPLRMWDTFSEQLPEPFTHHSWGGFFPREFQYLLLTSFCSIAQLGTSALVLCLVHLLRAEVLA